MTYEMKCPEAVYSANSIRQDFPGLCGHCNYMIIDMTKPERKRGDFKYVYGFRGYNNPDKICIIFECPDCFKRSHFHVHRRWIKLYGQWIDEVSIFAEEWK